MKSVFVTKLKDRTPMQTVKRIRDILSDLDIMVKEDWLQDIENYYSLNLNVVGTNIFSNGKGTSYEFALASAYGELIERIQNLCFMRFNRGMSDKAKTHGGFFYAPDEKSVGIDEMIFNNESWLKALTFEASTDQDKKETLRKWYMVGDPAGPDQFTSIPYLNITKGNISYIPVIMLLFRYGTNGMCAGNTIEEALVQGISEVIERFVQLKIIHDKITPPTIPDTYIMKEYPAIYEMIKKLESKGDFKVIVKDCSLEKAFPAAAIIFLDRKNRSYIVKFGANPSIEIAIERCLTELMQGRELKNRKWWMKEFSYSNNEVYSYSNLMSITTNGSGYYPSGFFSEKYSYEFLGIKDSGSYSNKEMLTYLINLMSDNKLEIIIRDVSFLGFPAFHIIVPSFSEFNDSNEETIKRVLNIGNVHCIFTNLENSSNQELAMAIDYMKESEYSPYDSIKKALPLTLAPGFPWDNMKRDLFISSAYYRMRDFKNAYDTMCKYIKLAESITNNATVSYLSCVRDYFGALSDGLSDEEKIRGLLSKFYSQDILDKAISDIKNPDKIFKNSAKLDCFNCTPCTYKKYCYYEKTEDIYLKLKDKYLQNIIDQSKNKNLCSLRNRV